MTIACWQNWFVISHFEPIGSQIPIFPKIIEKAYPNKLEPNPSFIGQVFQAMKWSIIEVFFEAIRNYFPFRVRHFLRNKKLLVFEVLTKGRCFYYCFFSFTLYTLQTFSLNYINLIIMDLFEQDLWAVRPPF